MSRALHFLTQIRHYHGQRAPKFWKDNCKVYGNITYYPRHPDHVDPPITPTKLLVVQRVKPYKGTPYWDKAILDQWKLNDKKSDIAILKNTPEICAQLWKIKHLVKVTPLNQPDELPGDDGPYATWLHDNGDLLIAPRVDPAREKATLEHINNPKRLDRETLEYELRMRWLNPWHV